VSEGPTRTLILWLTVIVLWATWVPTGTGPPQFRLSLAADPRDVLVNLVLFVPVALVSVVGSLGASRPVGQGEAHQGSERAAVVRATILVAALSLFVELGQTQVPGRTVSALDVALNVGGGLTAAAVVARLLRRPARAPWLVGGTVGGVFAMVIGLLVVTGHEGARLLRLSDWNPVEHMVVAGAEVGGGSPFRGTVDGAVICGGPEGEEVCVEPGAGRASRELLTDAVMASQRVRLAAVVTSEAASQSGPARIVSFSPGYGQRNATLAQMERTLVLRLRTPAAGPNGTDLVFELPEAVPQGIETRVAAEYGPGRVSLVASTDAGSRAAVYRWGTLSAWGIFHILPREHFSPGGLWIMAGVAAAALSLPVGAIAAAVGWGFGARILLALGGGPGLLTAMSWPLGGRTGVHELVLCAAFGLLGLAVGLPRSVHGR
jgi:hypothetical protein